MINCTILNEFSENFQMASDPPTPPALISENYVALFSRNTIDLQQKKIGSEVSHPFFPKIP